MTACVFDFETNLIDFDSAWWHDDSVSVVMVAWQLDGEPVKHYYGNVLECREFWEALDRASLLVAQNAKFEQHWLRRLGWDIHSKPWFDTKLAEKLIIGNRKLSISLDAMCERYGFDTKEKVIASMMRSGVDPADMPRDRLIARCRRDTRTTGELYRAQRAILEERKMMPLLATRCALTPVLVDIERAGMTLDRERVMAEYKRTVTEYDAACAELAEITGGINPRSSDQMAEFLYGTLKLPERKMGKRGRPRRNAANKRWPEGKPLTDKNTIAWLAARATTKKQKRFFEVQRRVGELGAALSKNLDFFRGVVEERDGARFFAEFNQGRTATDRLSSSGLPQSFSFYDTKKSVQFQNMPRAYKPLFRASRPGYAMVESDGMQIEFRVAGFLGRDKEILRFLREKIDVHKWSASHQFQVPMSAVTKEQRQAAKAATFKPLYGGRRGTEAEERYYAAFREQFADLTAEQERWVGEVLATGELVTCWGKRFYFDHYIGRSGEPFDKHTNRPLAPSVYNYPVQSLATAEIIPIALILLAKLLRETDIDATIVNTVHDSIIAEVRLEHLEVYRNIVAHVFTTGVYTWLKNYYGIDFDYPLGVEIKWGSHWSDPSNEGSVFEEATQEAA